MGLTLGVVVLTMGDRPVELARAVESLHRQTRPPDAVLVIGNGADVPPQPGSVRVLRLPANLGIVGGRDLGWRELDTDLVQFLDDDAWLLGDDVLAGVVRQFEDDPRLGIVSMRIIDPATGLSSRRHVPRLRTSDPERSSDVTTFLGGASIVRRTVLERCGGAADRVLVRPRGDRPRLGRARRRVADPLRGRRGAGPPHDHAGAARDVPAAQRPQPRVAGAAPPAVAAGGPLPGGVDGTHGGAGA